MKTRIPIWKRSGRAYADFARNNTIRRQYMKKELDRKLEYSTDELQLVGGNAYEAKTLQASQPNWVRLLDEGVVIECDGTIEAVIAKGAVKQWYDTLPQDFEGEIDKDHNHSIHLGKFTKNDLQLVELGDGRYGVDVDVKLDTELYATKDLLRMNNRRAISSEFFAIENYKMLKASDILGRELKHDYAVPLMTEIAITGYGVVETPLNANSYDDQLLERAFSAEAVDMEGTDMDPELEAQKNAELEAATAEAEEAKAEEATEEAAEETEAEAEATEAEAEANTEAENAEEAKAEEEAEVEASADTDVQEESINECEASATTLDDLETAIETMKKELAARDAKIAELESKLSNTKVAQNEFQTRLAKMLNFATETEPTVEEGKETTPAENNEEKEGDAVVNAYAAAFAELNK